MEIKRLEKGFTLVELLVTMAIMGLIVAGIYNLFDVHNRMAAKQEETTLMQQELLSLMVMMSNELRMCGYSTVDQSKFGFAHLPSDADYRRGTNATHVYCTVDVNGTGEPRESGNGSSADHVGYALNIDASGKASADPQNRNIVRKYTTGNVRWQPAAMNIRELHFKYFDANGVEITDSSNNLNQIRSVEITATATASPERSGLNIPDRHMSTRVFCRNMVGR